MTLGPEFRKLWTASTISNLGDGARLTALPLLAATVTRDPALVAGVLLATRLPWLLFALIGGAVADRVDRRGLMAWMQVARMAIMAVVALAAFAGWAGLPLLYAGGFLLGLCEVLFDVSAQSVLPAIVDHDQLEKANGRLLGAELVTNQFAGQPLGGALFALAPGLPFVVDSLTFGVAGGLISRLRGRFTPERDPADPSSIWADVKEGLNWLMHHRLLRTFALMTGVMNMMFSAVEAILVLFALQILGLNAAGFGALFVPMALGSLLSTALTDQMRRVSGVGPLLMFSVFVLGATLLGTGLTSSWVVVAILSLVSGFFNMTWNIIVVSLRQRIIPDRLMGRINSVYRLLAWGSMPVGAALGGLVAREFGLRAPFIVGAAVVFLLLLVTLPIVNTRNIEAAELSTQPHPIR